MASCVQALRCRTHHEQRPTYLLLTIFALSGEAEKLTLHFEEGSDPETFVEQALPQLPDRVLGKGETTGFVVNYTPDEAIKYQYDKLKEVARFRKVGQDRASSIVRNHHRRFKRVSSRTLSGLFRG